MYQAFFERKPLLKIIHSKIKHQASRAKCHQVLHKTKNVETCQARELFVGQKKEVISSCAD